VISYIYVSPLETNGGRSRPQRVKDNPIAIAKSGVMPIFVAGRRVRLHPLVLKTPGMPAVKEKNELARKLFRFGTFFWSIVTEKLLTS
jgi:hypothetical protein